MTAPPTATDATPQWAGQPHMLSRSEALRGRMSLLGPVLSLNRWMTSEDCSQHGMTMTVNEKNEVTVT